MANGTGGWFDQLNQTANDMWGPPTSTYGENFTIKDQVDAMPNSEKLSGTERWLYEKLPGFSESSIGKALMTFGESPAGKILGKLDVLAEGLERTLGLVAQYRDQQPGDELRLKEAWQAGTLFYETANLPRLQFDENNNVTGIQMDTDMPGSFALTEARKMLQDGKTIDEVRERLYSSMGALALRAQLQDTLGHIALDPLNWALGAVKPIERLHAIRNLALTGKIDVQTVRLMEKEAKLAGNLEDAAKFAEAATKAEKNGKAITGFDRFAIALTGGTPYLQDVTKMTSKQKWLAKLNPFALTPQARASELLDVVAANVGEYLIRPNFNKDPEEFLKVLASAAKGAVGPEWGHAAMTMQGRTVQGILSNSDALAKGIGEEWHIFQKERGVLEMLGTVLGHDEHQIYQMAQKSPEALFKRILAASELSLIHI